VNDRDARGLAHLADVVCLRIIQGEGDLDAGAVDRRRFEGRTITSRLWGRSSRGFNTTGM